MGSANYDQIFDACRNAFDVLTDEQLIELAAATYHELREQHSAVVAA